MFAIVADRFDLPSETFIRAHVRHIAPGRRVLLCGVDDGARDLGCPVLCDIRSRPPPRGPLEQAFDAMRLRWWRHVDPALAGADEARVRAFLLRHGVRAVMAEFGYNGCLLMRACRRAGIPLYAYFHGRDATQLARSRSRRRHYRRFFRQAAGSIAPSRFLADRLRALGCPEDRLHVVPNGVDPAQFLPTRREPGRVIAVSRLVPMKGPLQTIRAFAALRAAMPQATLDIVGDGPLRDDCMRLVAESGLAGAVTFHGAQPPARVADLMSRASLFVQHSVTTPDGLVESFGVAPLEAAASAVPVVVTRSGGLAETVLDGETGLLVAENDVAGMAAAMQAILRDPARGEAMGRTARARVEATFRHEHVAARLRAIMGLPD
jgi:glycosyltransferase involved in cell wall biosynthesis